MPALNIAKMLFDKFFSSPEEQGKVAERLIQTGKQNGVSEMEIELIDKGGLHLNVPMDDCKIDFHVGKNQKTKIRVKYK